MEQFPGEFPDYIGSPESIPAGADLAYRVTALDRQRRWLELKCEDLRRSCRELFGVLNGHSPLSPAEVADLQTDRPHRPLGEVFADFRLLREEAGRMVQPTGEPDGVLAARAVELAEAVTGLRRRRAELRRMYLVMSDAAVPVEPLTDDEVVELMRAADGPAGPSILDIVAEVEAELARGG